MPMKMLEENIAIELAEYIQRWYTMGPFEKIESDAMAVLRVPGGWLVTPKHFEEIQTPAQGMLADITGAGAGSTFSQKIPVYEQSVFIPYNDEFRQFIPPAEVQ